MNALLDIGTSRSSMAHMDADSVVSCRLSFLQVAGALCGGLLPVVGPFSCLAPRSVFAILMFWPSCLWKASEDPRVQPYISNPLDDSPRSSGGKVRSVLYAQAGCILPKCYMI